jgi:Uma2 family endonuclease
MATAQAQARLPAAQQSFWEVGEPRLLEIPAYAHTYAGFLKWIKSTNFPEKLRVSYLAGEVWVDMSEEAIDTHAAVKTGIYRTLLPLVEKIDFGEFYTDGVLLSNEAADISTNPDGIAARWETFESGKIRYIKRKGILRSLEGTADWVMEVVSENSVGKDTKQLRDAYHRAGVAEYWLIDARKDQLLFQILLWQRSGFVAAPHREGWQYSRVFDRWFRLTRKRNRLGSWQYKLHVRREIKSTKAKQ